MSRTKKQKVNVRLVSNEVIHARAGFAVLHGPDKMRIERTDDKGGSILLTVACEPDAPLGFHSIQCRIGPEGKEAETVSLLVQVTD